MYRLEDLPHDLHLRLERLLGQPIVGLARVGGGYTPALRLRLHLRDHSTIFIKVGVTPPTAEWLRTEVTFYNRLDAAFMPRLMAWEDHPDTPVLALEDLSTAFWPPPWDRRHVGLVLDTLAQLAELRLPDLILLSDKEILFSGWQQVAAAPEEFLALGLATPSWLERALPELLAVNVRQALVGDALVHCDIRSDNLCFAGNQVKIVDWNLACRGSPDFDLASWLPSLHAEGGPSPEELLPCAPEFATLMSGFFAARAGKPVIPEAPLVRVVQLQQLRTALPWAVRALQLPPLDGPDL
jgi:hypothetical protein